MKIGGPDARNDISKSLEIGCAGIIAPMVESPFGVYKFVNAVEDVAGIDLVNKIILSINLESITAYQKLPDIISTDEMRKINEVVIGVSDLARSVGKPTNDIYVLNIIEEMINKLKETSKLVRVGGLFSFLVNNPEEMRRLIIQNNVDEINTSNVAFNVQKIRNMNTAYQKARDFELTLNDLWVKHQEAKLTPYKKRASSKIS